MKKNLMSFKFYYIDSNYLEGLAKLDSKVYLKENRAYVGIIFRLSEFYFFAPLSSPKTKHARLQKPSVYKLHKINDPNSPLGIININNMIPVPLEKVSLVDMNVVSKKYKLLLLNQLRFIKKNQDDIKKCAEDLYYKAKAKHVLATNCVNFEVLENYCTSISVKN